MQDQNIFISSEIVIKRNSRKHINDEIPAPHVPLSYKIAIDYFFSSDRVNIGGSEVEDDVCQEYQVYCLVEGDEKRWFELVWVEADCQRDDNGLVNWECNNKEIPVLPR